VSGPSQHRKPSSCSSVRADAAPREVSAATVSVSAPKVRRRCPRWRASCRWPVRILPVLARYWPTLRLRRSGRPLRAECLAEVLLGAVETGEAPQHLFWGSVSVCRRHSPSCPQCVCQRSGRRRLHPAARGRDPSAHWPCRRQDLHRPLGPWSRQPHAWVIPAPCVAPASLSPEAGVPWGTDRKEYRHRIPINSALMACLSKIM